MIQLNEDYGDVIYLNGIAYHKVDNRQDIYGTDDIPQAQNIQSFTYNTLNNYLTEKYIWDSVESRRHIITSNNVVLDGVSGIILNGSSDYIATESTTDGSFGTNDFTIRIDFELDSVDNTIDIIGGNHTSEWLLRGDPNWGGTGIYQLGFYVNNVAYKWNWTPLINTPYRCTIIREINELTIYVNEIALGISQTVSGDISYNNPIQIGKGINSSNYLDGRISYVHIENYNALTPISTYYDITNNITLLSLKFIGDEDSSIIIDSALPTNNTTTPLIAETVQSVNAIQNTLLNRPNYIISGQNNLPTLYFDSSDYMDCGNNILLTQIQSLSWNANQASTSLISLSAPVEGADAPYILESVSGIDASGSPAGQYLGTSGPDSSPVIRFATTEKYIPRQSLELSDDFDSSPINTDRWTSLTKANLGEIPQIVNNKLRCKSVCAVDGVGSNSVAQQLGTINYSDDFNISIDYTVAVETGSQTPNGYWGLLRLTIGGSSYYVGYTNQEGPLLHGHMFQHPGGYYDIASLSAAPSYEFIRTGNSLVAYANGVQIGSPVTISGNLTNITVYTSNATVGEFTVDYDNLIALDGSGNPLKIVMGDPLAISTPCSLNWHGKFTIPASDQLLIGDTTTGTGIGVGTNGIPYATDGTNIIYAPQRVILEASDDFTIDGTPNVDRWVQQVGTWEVSGGYLINIAEASDTNYIDNNVAANNFLSYDVIKGDFAISGTLSVPGFGDVTDNYRQISPYIYFGSLNRVTLGFYSASPVDKYFISTPVNTIYYASAASGYEDIPWSISRVGSTVSADINGNIRTFTDSTDVSFVRNYSIRTVGVLPMTAKFGPIVLNDNANGDGTGNPLYVPFPWDDDFHRIIATFSDASSEISIDNTTNVLGDLSLAEINDFEIMPGTVAGDMVETTYINTNNQQITNNLIIDQPFAINYVGKFTTPASDKIIFGDSNLNMGVGSNGIPYIESSLSGKIQAQSPVSGDWSNDWHVFTGIFDGANSEIRVDNLYSNTGDIGIQSISATQICVSGLVMEHGEIKIYDTLTTFQRNNEYNELYNKWILSVSAETILSNYIWSAENSSIAVSSIINPPSGDITPYIYETEQLANSTQLVSINQPTFLTQMRNNLPILNYDESDYMNCNAINTFFQSLSWNADQASTSLSSLSAPAEAADAPYILESVSGIHAIGSPAGQYLGTSGPNSSPVIRFATTEKYVIVGTPLSLSIPCDLTWYGKFTTPASDQLLIGDTTTGTGIGVGTNGLPYVSDGTNTLMVSPREIEASDDFEDNVITNWNVNDDQGTIIEETSGKLIFTNSSGGNFNDWVYRTLSYGTTGVSGDFNVEVSFNITDWNTGGSSFIYQAFLSISTNTAGYRIYRAPGLQTCIQRSSPYFGSCQSGGIYALDQNKHRIRRTSGRIYYDVWNGTGWTTNGTSFADATDLINVRINHYNDGGAFTGTTRCEIDYILITDGDDIPINPVYVSWDDDFHEIQATINGSNSNITIDNANNDTGDLSLAEINDFEIMPGTVAGDMVETTYISSNDQLIINQPFIVNYVGKFTTPVSDKIIFGDSSLNMGVGSNGIPYIESSLSGKIQAPSGDWSNDWHIFTGIFDGANSEIRVDNLYSNTGDIGTQSINLTQICEDGLAMEHGEIKIYDTLTSAQINTEYDLLYDKWFTAESALNNILSGEFPIEYTACENCVADYINGISGTVYSDIGVPVPYAINTHINTVSSDGFLRLWTNTTDMTIYINNINCGNIGSILNKADAIPFNVNTDDEITAYTTDLSGANVFYTMRPLVYP